MRALVLGGKGFIGGHVVDSLLAAGHQVRILDRAPDSTVTPVVGADVFYGDFADKAFVYEAASGVDVVYHLISTTVPSTSNLDPVADVRGNIIPTIGLLSCMVELSIPKIVFLSSGGTVYGNPEELPIKEGHPLRPRCSYGVVKVAIENYLTMFQQLYGVDRVILRAANPFGERQGHFGVQGVVNTFLLNALAEKPIEIWGDGSVIRDYLYVGDLANLCVRVGEKEITGIFNAGSGAGRSVNDIVDAVERVTGRSLDPRYLPSRSYDVPEVVLDISRAREQLGWSPRFSMEEGLDRVWAWLQQ
ncbi:MAG: NAD-dependent epimerase/dehydratase family protein [Gammaproteobacteria bacterium]|nr:NAD-dependent epimerase/dehydratase family protein [Gammaproteobacteria bacterium]